MKQNIVLTCTLLLWALTGGTHSLLAQQNEAARAKAAFERFKTLEGQWLGRSTKGWEEKITFKVIAGGSAVHESSFDAHPNETMVTVFHLDGERLLLTHYCVAKNQPRLQLTAVEDGGKKLTFTFLDATNLPSRNKGHMDKVVYRFLDDDHLTSQWTWYQDGKENWLEEIKLERLKAAPPEGAKVELRQLEHDSGKANVARDAAFFERVKAD